MALTPLIPPAILPVKTECLTRREYGQPFNCFFTFTFTALFLNNQAWVTGSRSPAGMNAVNRFYHQVSIGRDVPQAIDGLLPVPGLATHENRLFHALQTPRPSASLRGFDDRDRAFRVSCPEWA